MCIMLLLLLCYAHILLLEYRNIICTYIWYIFYLYIFATSIYTYISYTHPKLLTTSFFLTCTNLFLLFSLELFFIIIIFISFNSYPHINSSRSWSMISAWNKYKFEYLHYSFLIECKVGILFFLLHLMKPIYTYNCEIIVCYFFYVRISIVCCICCPWSCCFRKSVSFSSWRTRINCAKHTEITKKKKFIIKEKRVFFFLFCKKQ